MRNPKYNMHLKNSGVELFPGMMIGQVEPHLEELQTHMKESNEVNNGIFKEQEWVAGYATVYSRKAVNAVGLFDTKFKNGCEDLDFCKRLKKFNYKIGQALDSFVFHFGGISRGAYKLEDKEEYSKEDIFNHQYLNEKWGKKSVVIYTGPMWHKWDFRNVDNGGIGGSETWAVMLAREFVKLGYRVKVFADCPESGIKDGEVEYLHYNEYPSYIDQNWIDYFISSRTTDPYNFPIRAGKKFVQIHDIFMLSQREQTHLDKVDKYAALSKWHLDFASDYHKIPKEKMVLMANGLDLSRYDQKVERNPYRMFWSSSLDRGLDTLLYLFDFIKKEVPELELHVFYGIFNWSEAAKQRNNPEELRKIEEIKEGLKKPGVFYHDRIGQRDLAIEQMRSSLWAYPTDFEETFSITALEAQAAGCPVIASNYAGLQTTIGDSGILIGNGSKGQSFTKEYREEFVKECVENLKDQEKWKVWSEKGKENAKEYSWKNCALIWRGLFEA